MLKFTISNRKQPPTPVVWPPKYMGPPVTQTPAVNVELYREAQRRDKIVKELFKNLQYKAGDDVVPVKCANPDEELATIVGVCSCYAHMNKDNDWPATDNPLIVTARRKKDNTIYFCTTNYLKKV